MKKLHSKLLSIAFVILLMGTITQSTASILILKNQSLVISTKNNEPNITNIDPKISTILEMINETLLREYLETLVGYGPRMTGTYGCQKAAEYIYQKFKIN